MQPGLLSHQAYLGDCIASTRKQPTVYCISSALQVPMPLSGSHVELQSVRVEGSQPINHEPQNGRPRASQTEEPWPLEPVPPLHPPPSPRKDLKYLQATLALCSLLRNTCSGRLI